MQSKISTILEHEAKAIKNIPVTDSYEKAVLLIKQQVHNKNGKVVTSGMGKAGQIAHNIATTLSSTGTPAIFIHPSEAQHGDLGAVQENDILLLISNSGKTREVLEMFHLTKNLYPKMHTIAIASQTDCPLAELTDVIISTGNPTEVCALGLSPTTSTTVMTVIGDILVVLLMEAIGFSKEDYAKRHHGGYLGQISRGELRL
jgi:arabinose-5-phosphate isomerase